jgi:TRAP transporter 4TM/12TM fusion protein
MSRPDPVAPATDVASHDPELSFRPLAVRTSWIVGTLLVGLSAFHYYTAGFGLLREATHRGVHLALVLGLIFLVFAFSRSEHDQPVKISPWRPGGLPWYDWLLAAAAMVTSLYVPWEFDDLAFRVGDPWRIDVVFGTLMLLLVLEATRRAMGPTLPLIASIFVLYALLGPWAPGVLVHPGTSWTGLINHLYLTSQGIYGIAVGVVATYVFHFVLFGVLATRIGLGQLFIDLATVIAGRFAGGPAKVAVLSSALLGTISGSSIANTVTTGALTIPAMIRLGYPRHFAAAVEATASAGGQITPPIMGAAAFIMVEFLEIPYREILLAALVPASMHYLGVLTMVHLEARRLGLRGLSREELPQLGVILRGNWPSLVPVILLVAILLRGHTPFLAAFWGITACIVIGVLNPRHRLSPRDLIDGFQLGARYALAIGAAAATVGVVVGVVSLTGMGFKLSFMITSLATDLGASSARLVPFQLITAENLALFFTLLLTAVACILMGAGIPTTATYIILVTVAAPALTLLGLRPLVAHFFVLYFGVLADITPPVALAAYAAAGIAGADPFRTGNTAFRLASAKALVPFVFAYAPVMLIVGGDFAWLPFLTTTLGCALGVICIGVALTGFLAASLGWWERLLSAAAGLFLVAPGLDSALIGMLLLAPVGVRQVRSSAGRV